MQTFSAKLSDPERIENPLKNLIIFNILSKFPLESFIPTTLLGYNFINLSIILNVIGTPVIHNISLEIMYPNYVGRRDETIKNSGNLRVPEGAKIRWQVQTLKTDSLAFITDKKRAYFKKFSDNNFEYTKEIQNAFNYEISSSNKKLRDYENLQFSVDVLKDEYPLNLFTKL